MKDFCGKDASTLSIMFSILNLAFATYNSISENL